MVRRNFFPLNGEWFVGTNKDLKINLFFKKIELREPRSNPRRDATVFNGIFEQKDIII
ncbi:hypothetical protein LEP1GSC052_2995 [Leptospira kmetyi serovar Malaysia str. Bejo-Iso9]|nr:hypothetical protein LEP1GSC052_2995 [Leptospira kmetyi serovar Malaysia str. Bejo-Iso9]